MNERFVAFVKRLLAVMGRAFATLVVLLVVVSAVGIWWFRHREMAAKAPAADVAVPRGTRAIELYFPDASGEDLDLETREVVEDEVEGEALVRTVVNALLMGPEQPGLKASFPDGVTLNHVYRDPGGGLYLDFSTSLRSGFRGGSTAEQLLVSSLLRTLAANVPGLSHVTVTAGGLPLLTLGGHVRLDGPLLVSEWR